MMLMRGGFLDGYMRRARERINTSDRPQTARVVHSAAMRWMLLVLAIAGCDEATDADPAKRRSAAAAYGASYPHGAAGVALLVDMVGDENASVRKAAAQSLAKLGALGSPRTRAFSWTKRTRRMSRSGSSARSLLAWGPP